MVSEWVKYCDSADFALDGPHVDVTFGNDRRHRVTVTEAPEEFLLQSVVVRRAAAASLPDLPIQVWTRNRGVALVGFRIDRRGRLVGEAWIPKAGITISEFQMYVRAVAAEADRFEYALTGRDSE